MHSDHLDLAKGEHKTPELQALNPNGALSILHDGDFALYESNAIMQYLADRNGPSSLYPANAQDRARVTQWLSWQMCHFGPTTTPYVFEHVVKGLVGLGAPDLERLEKVAPGFAKYGAVLEQQLGQTAFVAGDLVTLADFAIASKLMWAGAAQIPWQTLPKVRAWYERVAALPAWRDTEPRG